MWDVFISHAGEDIAIARELKERLSQLGVEVWFAESTLLIGDSLHERIDYGLANSRFGIVILSKDFFAKKWPRRELDGLAAREVDGKKVILPVHHDIDEKKVAQFSPLLADRLAVPTSKGIDVVAFEIMKVLGTEVSEPPAPEENSLNPSYTFEKFVVGSCNQFAHAAAEGAAESPGRTYNPLFIYGGVGMGKTHLMHAIGHSIKQRNRLMNVMYIRSEKFMNELISAIRHDKTQTFREKYRSIDVLLMDDVQFLAGKERTQEEFFHTFDTLHNDRKQIVMTSDCPPREIPTLEERLHSRLEWGLIADIEPPDLETKVAMLKRKAYIDRVELPDDVAIFIAGKVRSNIRELESALVRVRAISSLRGLPLSKMLAQDALRYIINFGDIPD